MCGIFGISTTSNKNLSLKEWERQTNQLLKSSMLRGQDASGIVSFANTQMRVAKNPCNPKKLMKTMEYKSALSILDGRHDFPRTVIGHTRLTTTGSRLIETNIQPIVCESLVGVHNGIVANLEKDVGESSPEESDSLQLFKNLDEKILLGLEPTTALNNIFSRISGVANLAFYLAHQKKILLATNNGSIYFAPCEDIFYFASEKSFLIHLFKMNGKLSELKNIRQLKANTGITINCTDNSFESFELQKYIEHGHKLTDSESKKVTDKISIKMNTLTKKDSTNLKRCTECVLPETYPFIQFDDKGVCNFCLKYEKQIPKGEEKLEEILSQFRGDGSQPDCLVGFSGGRDSSYGLHLLKTKFGMTPIAYTYDWGLLTDLSRKNQSTFLSKLQVEQIVRAPDIAQKRENVKKNVNAWLDRPKLGMVPLFMAGDKDFYHYGRQLRKELDIDLTIFCAGQQLEQREFMVGFCGVNQSLKNNLRLYEFKLLSKIRLAMWYSTQYLLNPGYINQSLMDSVRSFFTSFIRKDDFLYLYEYIPWNEKKIESLLQNEYGWKKDSDFKSNQWRMGDGQTAFTNYIYYKLAGFSEFDDFRSNQIREGMISRKEALELVNDENQPKQENLNFFGHVVGLDMKDVLKRINSIPKIY